MKFCVNKWRQLEQKTKGQLMETAQIFFHLLDQFAKLKQTRCTNIIILENRVQNLLSADCRPFQLYFYKNLFNPYELSKIVRHKQLTKKFEEDHNL